MDAEQLKEDIRAGKVGLDRLVELIEMLQRQLQETRRENEQLKRQLRQAGTQKVSEPYSVRSEEERQAKRGKKPRKQRKRSRRRGRIKTADKIARAERTEKVFPEEVPEADCRRSHTRVAWRLENGQAVLVAYEVYVGPKKQYGRIPGVVGRSEFGIEISLTIAFLVYVMGLSFDKVCALLQFFQNLQLTKSQADALLERLSRHWEEEFERLCMLLANSAVVHADETRWSLNSVWAFLSEKVRLLFFGVHKDAGTLGEILNPETFSGIVVSDDAAVYGQFTNSQKCWAHLLRKAIKLTLLDPDNEEYRRFTDRLLEIYRTACRIARDRRLSDAGRKRKVAELDDEILELCNPISAADLPPSEGPANDYRLLCNELMRLMLTQELFTFVTAPAVETPQGEVMPVAGTNNEAERTLRSAAEARKTGRTSKTQRGARRRTIVLSVLESLRVYLPNFTLSDVLEEIDRWIETGQSCFAELLAKLSLPPPAGSVLDHLYPTPSG